MMQSFGSPISFWSSRALSSDIFTPIPSIFMTTVSWRRLLALWGAEKFSYSHKLGATT